MKIRLYCMRCRADGAGQLPEPRGRQRHLSRRRRRPERRRVRRAIDGANFDFDASDTAYKVIAGWRFLDWLSVEANYVDLGSGDDRVEGSDIEADVDGVLARGAWVSCRSVRWTCSRGWARSTGDAELSAPGTGFSGSDDGTDLIYGVGAQFRVWGLSFRAEYEMFDISDADTVDMISPSVTWTFL